MKSPLLPWVVTCLGLVLAGCSKPTESTPTPKSTSGSALKPIRPTSFEEVTSQLDPGGTVYGYLATDQWLAGLATNVAGLRNLVQAMPELPAKDQQKIDQVFDVLTDTIARSGLEQLTGVGLSGIQISPELYRTKFILHHARGKGDGLFWNVMGKQPHELAGLNLLPKETALAAFGDLDINVVWQTVVQECAKVPELAQGLKKWETEFEQNTQLGWQDLLDSLGGEVGFVFTHDEANLIDVPFVDGLQLPEPGLLLAVKVKNDLVYDRISSELKKNTMVQITEEKGLKMCAMPIPLPLPVQLEITVARSGDYLFIATSSKHVRNLLAVRDGNQPGLRQSPEFAALLKYLPARGNQFVYADKKFSGTVLKLQQQLVDSGKLKPEQAKLVRELFLNKNPTYGLSIGAHMATGWQSVAVGNQDSSAVVVGTVAMLPAGILAGIAVPNFVKARETAQRNACINNLRMLDSAKEQWALENRKTNGETPTSKDIAAYLAGRRMPACPAGGRYTLGKIGVAPKCSQPGHNLNP